ncbi:ORF6N domain-containing protein [Pedobacter sp. N36a]|uniref:ORF6N domain-containing protein n=1 Tax=Pedobacter sp. N36a TaxID=2767996 RepID=UPI00210293C7|nr:ORF6N domain-containing protein [Pedobacter sp. N36a]
MSPLKNVTIPDEVVMSKIYMVRDQKVMLDRDLAELYGVKSIRLREQVKRNKERFPENFMFQLSDQEVEDMVSQNAIPSKQALGGALPYVFTEHGVLMLSNVLKSERAIQMSICIIEIFVKLREMLLLHKDVSLQVEQVEKRLVKQDEKIELLFTYLSKFIEKDDEPRKPIGFKRKGE